MNINLAKEAKRMLSWETKLEPVQPFSWGLVEKIAQNFKKKKSRGLVQWLVKAKRHTCSSTQGSNSWFCAKSHPNWPFPRRCTAISYPKFWLPLLRYAEKTEVGERGEMQPAKSLCNGVNIQFVGHGDGIMVRMKNERANAERTKVKHCFQSTHFSPLLCA